MTANRTDASSSGYVQVSRDVSKQLVLFCLAFFVWYLSGCLAGNEGRRLGGCESHLRGEIEGTPTA